jgi:hypothetical protein
MHLSYIGTSLKIPSRLEIGLLRSQPFTNTDFHFLIIVESAISEDWLELPNWNSSFCCLRGEMFYRMSLAPIKRPISAATGCLKLLPRLDNCVIMHGDEVEKIVILNSGK